MATSGLPNHTAPRSAPRGKAKRPYTAPRVTKGRKVEVAILGGGNSGTMGRMLTPRGTR